MMDERRRFQIALGGIATCLLIAALFVSSAPPLDYPAVRAPKAAYRVISAVPDGPPASLPASCGNQVPARVPAPAIPRAARAALPSRAVPQFITVRNVPAARLQTEPVPSAPLRPRAQQIPLTIAPAPRAAGQRPDGNAALSAQAFDHHGRVTGVFVSAGREVGHGFRTAGRAIKSIF